MPSDISAAPMYDRIKDLQKQIEDKEKGILRLEKDRGNYSGGNISDVGLKNVIEKTIQRLEEAPKEKQREIFENVIQFAELSPGRIRIGVYSESDHQNPKKTIRVTRKGGSVSQAYSIFGSGESGGLGCSRTIKIGGFGDNLVDSAT